MPDSIENGDRVAVVTGAGRGIGAAIAADLDASGARVVVCDIDGDAARRTAKGLSRGEAFEVDLAQPHEIVELTTLIRNEIGHVDVFVSNAGFDAIGPFVDSEPETWDSLLAVNLRAPIQLTHLLLPGMLERRSGRLVYISSDAARVGSTGEAVYSACKAGLLGFARTIAREAARSSVTSNVVCPGPTNTKLLHDAFDGRDKLLQSLSKSIPMGRLGEPDDVSGLVAFLCSPRAQYLTGQTISVSGGLTMV